MNATKLARRGLLRAIAIAFTGVLLTAVMSATAFAADTPTIMTTVNPSSPEQGIAAQLTFSGTAAGGVDSTIYAVARPAGGVACQASFSADQAAAGSVNQVIAKGTADVAASSLYSVPVMWTPSASGSQLVCAWLEQPVSGGSPTVSATQSTSVTVAGPQSTTLSVALASTPIAAQSFQIQYTTQTDQLLVLRSVIRPSSSGPCDATYGADRTQFPHSTLVLTGTAVNGGPTVSTGQATLGPGSYIMCAWVQGPMGGEVDAATTTPFSIANPPPVPKPTPKPKPVKAAPAIAITSLTASATSAIEVQGTTAAGFAGTLTVTATCKAAKVTGAASASGGAFSAALALPTGCAAGSDVTVHVKWPGSATFKPDGAKSTTVVAGAPPKPVATPRPRTLFTHVRRHSGSVTNLFGTRPNRILIASAPRLILRLHWTRWTMKGGRGHGTAFTRQHHRYRINVTAGHAFHGTFACLTIVHHVGGRAHIRRLGLAREGRSLRWVGVTTLHSRKFKGTPWPLHHGCPAVRTARG